MEKILVYGMGQFWENYKNELCLKYNIVGFIDKKNTCIGENVYSSIKETMNIQYEKIIIMVSRVKVIFEIIKLLLDEGIAGNNIVLGINEFGDYAGKIQIYVDDMGRIVVEKDDIVIATWTEDEFANTIDTVLNECYKYYIPSGKKQIVFDVGMNIGDTAIYFASRPEVIAVYGFEPFKKTYIKALINIEKQKKVCTITPLNYGLSDKDAEIDIPYSSEMTCGQSTILSNTTKARKTYENRDLLQEKNFKCEKIVNKKSSNIIKQLMEKSKDVDYILKMDCEGEEYNIFQDISDSGLIKKFTLIMMEWHYRTDQLLIDILKENQFAYVSVQKSVNPDMGLIYAWKG